MLLISLKWQKIKHLFEYKFFDKNRYWLYQAVSLIVFNIILQRIKQFKIRGSLLSTNLTKKSICDTSLNPLAIKNEYW